MQLNSLLIKPAGPDCNLRCNYCFYRQKAGIYPASKEHRMKPATLECLISQVMRSESIRPCFAWQGGEPTLMGLDFFKRVVELEVAYGRDGQLVSNSLQTNGTLLHAKWAEFLVEYRFLVGVSLDGPADLHDHYRRDSTKRPTHRRVMESIRILREHGVEFNVLTLLNDRNVKEPDRLYDFLLDHGVFFMQFVPCVEPGGGGTPAPFSITTEQYGEFLCRMFDRWAADFPNVSIRDFDDLLARTAGRAEAMCVYAERCGDYLVVEHNGDVYPCDFFVQPKLRLGNIHDNSLEEIAALPEFKAFGERKSDSARLGECGGCEWLDVCHGGCQKHRLILEPRRTDSPSYFCAAYRRFFAHSRERIREMAERVLENANL